MLKEIPEYKKEKTIRHTKAISWATKRLITGTEPLFLEV
jgi:hypothetical protein